MKHNNNIMRTMNHPTFRPLFLLLLLQWCTAISACTDQNDEFIESLARQAGIADLTSCDDPRVIRACQLENAQGQTVREYCCQTCQDNQDVLLAPVPETSLPSSLEEGETLQVFFQNGQSECQGQASVELLRADLDYTDVSAEQDGVWLAALARGESLNPGRLFLKPMYAGDLDPVRFGPEIAIGPRLKELLGQPVLVIKYCWGGTNVHTNWNPSTDLNSWDMDADDGTADWLLENAVVDYQRKNSLMVNFAYIHRWVVEQLEAANVSYNLAGLFWIQGSGDSKRTWEEYGTDLARMFEAMRAEVGVPNLPIIDQGSAAQHTLRTGKAHAASLVRCQNARTIEWVTAVADPAETSCVPGPSNICPDSTFLNFQGFDDYGWDPLIVENINLLFPDPSEAESLFNFDNQFHWYRSFPTNQHSEYEGMLFKGYFLANAYVREFTDIEIPAELEDVDPVLKYPWVACAEGEVPSQENLCWVDERTGEEVYDDPTEDEYCTVESQESGAQNESDSSIEDSSLGVGKNFCCCAGYWVLPFLALVFTS